MTSERTGDDVDRLKVQVFLSFFLLSVPFLSKLPVDLVINVENAWFESPTPTNASMSQHVIFRDASFFTRKESNFKISFSLDSNCFWEENSSQP